MKQYIRLTFCKEISQLNTLQTFHFQVKGAAVKFVLVGHFTSVVACIICFGLNDVHLKCVDL